MHKTCRGPAFFVLVIILVNETALQYAKTSHSNKNAVEDPTHPGVERGVVFVCVCYPVYSVGQSIPFGYIYPRGRISQGFFLLCDVLRCCAGALLFVSCAVLRFALLCFVVLCFFFNFNFVPFRSIFFFSEVVDMDMLTKINPEAQMQIMEQMKRAMM